MIGKMTGQSGNKCIPDEFDLRKNMGAIIDKRYIIIVITFIFVFVGLLYAFLSSPVYHADALVQVDHSGEIDMMSNISQLLPAKSPVSATEMQLVTSRAILGETVAKLNLDTEVRFISFPIIGEAIRRYSQPGVRGSRWISLSHAEVLSEVLIRLKFSMMLSIR